MGLEGEEEEEENVITILNTTYNSDFYVYSTIFHVFFSAGYIFDLTLFAFLFFLLPYTIQHSVSLGFHLKWKSLYGNVIVC